MLNSVKHLDGALFAARYAFMPNKLRYCGGDRNSNLFDYVAEGESDQGLKNMLAEFETMYPYLKLISEANHIIDPFDYRVVEAYWIGNELLEKVSMKGLYRHMIDGQKMKQKFKPELLEKVFGKIPIGAKPHHSWHVFNIPKQAHYYPVEHTVETMDQCRISWGRVQKKKVSTENDLTSKLMVNYEPLLVENGKIVLGKSVEKEIWSEVNDKSFIRDLKDGDQVSMHWGWACDILTDSQVNNLKKWTKYNLALANIE